MKPTQKMIDAGCGEYLRIPAESDGRTFGEKMADVFAAMSRNAPPESQELTNYKLGFATQTEERERLEAENERLREVLMDLVAVTKDELLKLPEGYRARRAIDRATAALNIQQRAEK
jgi:regulator of replication initiation timing